MELMLDGIENKDLPSEVFYLRRLCDDFVSKVSKTRVNSVNHYEG
jgi:hypothetical protein